MYDLREMLCDELEKIAKKTEMSAGDLETAHKLTDTIKNIDKICIMDVSGEYSQAGDWEAELRGNYGRGNSYATNRNNMGQFSKNGGNNYSRNGMGYSREDEKDHMIEQLRQTMASAKSGEVREAIRRCISQLENA